MRLSDMLEKHEEAYREYLAVEAWWLTVPAGSPLGLMQRAHQQRAFQFFHRRKKHPETSDIVKLYRRNMYRTRSSIAPGMLVDLPPEG